jgi:hypothetical protein
MRLALAAALALTPACASLPPLSPYNAEAPPERSLDLAYGVREYSSEGGWPGVEEQPVIGLSLRWNRPREPLAFELGLNYAEDENEPPPPLSGIERRTTELSFGLRRQFTPIGAGFRPYLGGGLAVLHVWEQLEPFGVAKRSEDEDIDWGVYAHGGIEVELYEDVYIGVDLRLLGAEWTGGDYNLDYGQLAITVGSLF